MLNLTNLTIKRDERYIVKDLNINMKSGDVTCITGANGIGKTTLIKCLAGIITPCSGAILYGDINVAKCMDEYQSLLCYQPDTPVVDMQLSVKQNLMLWGKLNGREITIDAVLHTMQLTEIKDEEVSMLSRGQIQRVSMTRLLLSNASIWLLDEPYAHLDSNWIQYIERLFALKRSQGGIIVYSAHQASKVSSHTVLELGSVEKNS